MDSNMEKKYMFEDVEFDIRKFFFSLYKKRTFLIAFVFFVMVLDLVFTLKEKPMYRATSLILIETPSVPLSPTGSQEEVAPEIGALDYYNTQYEILESRTLLKRVMDTLNLEKLDYFAKARNPEEEFRELIRIDPVRKTRLVEVSVDYPNPEMATKMANTLVSLYIEQNIENILFMSKEILKAFPEESKKAESYAVYSQIKDMSREEMINSLPSVVNNPIIQNLKTEKITVETELANLSKRYKEKHPTIIALTTKLKFINNTLDLETARIVASIRADLAGNLQANNIRVIDYAETPEEPISPNVLLNLALGLFVSLLVGIGSILFIDHLNDTVQNEKDVTNTIGLPFLGAFPFLENISIKKEKEFFTQLEKISPDAVEAIRNVRTNILFSCPVSEKKIFSISSTVPQEGKTFFSCYIAYSFAKNGSKTLLIDADVRQPTVYKYFGIKRNPGLTDMLAEGTPLKDTLVVASHNENLHILPSGSKTPNPVELLGSEKMRSLIDSFSQKYDVIIIDTPPSLMLADSLILSSLFIKTILVVRSGMVSKDAVLRLKDRFHFLKYKIIGVVLNFFDITQHADYSHYKYYHKYYKDGYTQKEEQ